MPTIERSVAHDLGTEVATERIERFLGEAGKSIRLQYEQQGEEFAFTANVQGLNIRGNFQIGPDQLLLRVKLPLIAMPFTSWINRIMNVALKGAIPGQPATTSPTVGEAPPVEIPEQDGVLLFLHIPKAAGTTLGEYLFAQCRNGRPGASLLAGEGLYQEGVYYVPYGFFKTEAALVPDYTLPYLQDEQLRAVSGHFSFGLHELIPQPVRYFTMLRHPVDRILSLYYFLQAQDNLSLSDFLAAGNYRELDNDQTRRIAGVNPEFGACNEAHFELAKANLQQHFMVAGLSDRFEESVLHLKLAMGWQQDFWYYPRNVTAGRPKKEEIADEHYQQILALNKWDVQLYHFASELLDARTAALGPDFQTSLANYREKLQLQKSNNL